MFSLMLVISWSIIGFTYRNYSSSFSSAFDISEYKEFQTLIVNSYNLKQLNAEVGKAGDIFFYVYTTDQLDKTELEQVGLSIQEFIKDENVKTEIVEKYYKASPQFGVIRVLFFTNNDKEMHYTDKTYNIDL